MKDMQMEMNEIKAIVSLCYLQRFVQKFKVKFLS